METCSGIELAYNLGPVGGYICSSFRAEAYGILLLALFIHHIHEYTKTRFQAKFKLYLDSQSAVQKINEFTTFTKYYSSATLSADWDVLQTAAKYCGLMMSNILLSHVKGHQDDDKEISELPLKAKLNINNATQPCPNVGQL